MDYDFSQLNDKEFEVLACDLLSNEFRVKIERFKPGKDAGVDGRFFDAGGEVILQCKHWAKSGTVSLLRSLGKSEVQKILKLNPRGYVFVTSCQLSRANKKKILSLFSPFIAREDLIFGQEDLNSLLIKYPEVERTHSKLWMCSSALLRKFLNNDVVGRSDALLERLVEKRRLFVETDVYRTAIERLEKQRALIVIGEPGIGKTTLAHALYLNHASRGYEVFDIIKDLSEGEKLYEKGVKQFFLFDDFLGSNLLDALSEKTDSQVVKFIDRVRFDSTKRFVLTSRTNILNRGKVCSDVLKNGKIDRNEYLISVNDLANIEKAKILYNHLWHSGLEDGHVDVFYEESRYLQLVKHRNFNPRIVEFITDSGRAGFPKSGEYWDFISSSFENPSEIWRNCFYRQSSEACKFLVKAVVFLGDDCGEDLLRTAYERWRGEYKKHFEMGADLSFSTASKEAVGSFLNRQMEGEGTANFALFNPSIADFIFNEYGDDVDELFSILRHLQDTIALRTVETLADDGRINEVKFESLVVRLLDDCPKVSETCDYRISIVESMTNAERIAMEIHEIIKELTEKPVRLESVGVFLMWLDQYDIDLDRFGFDFIIDCCGDEYLDCDELESLSGIAEEYFDCPYEFWEFVEDKVTAFMDAVVEDLKNDIDFSLFGCEYGSGVFRERSWDISGARDWFVEKLWQSVDDLHDRAKQFAQGTVSDLVEKVDFVDLFNEHANGSLDVSAKFEPGGDVDNSDDAIHDLFSRG